MVIFLYNLNIFVWIQHDCLANTVFTLDPSNSVTKRLWCICFLVIFLFIIFSVYVKDVYERWIITVPGLIIV